MNKVNEIYKLDNEHGNIESSLNYFLKFNINRSFQILDLGCGYGSLIYNLLNLGFYNIYGIDINIIRINKGLYYYKKLKSKLIHYDKGEIPFENCKFDVILMFDVIEHIPGVENFIKSEVSRVMKNDGLLIFSTPNKFINIPWEIINQKSLTKYKRYHCSLQNIISLRRTLIQAGFGNIIIEKNNIITDHNKNKVKNKIGMVGLPLLYLLQTMPLFLFSNFWGSCRKA